MKKLNLGCGALRLEGYINVDLNVEADLKHDLMKALPYPDDSVDHVLASHVLEHFGQAWSVPLLRDWCRVVKPGGTFHILVPDLMECMRRFLDDHGGRRWSWWLKTIYGGQWNEGEYHKTGFSAERLAMLVEEACPRMKAEIVYEQDPKRDPEISILFTKLPPL